MSNSSKAVFLSYASQDAEAAKRICEALRAAGVEVWFDQSELVGGDAWDRKIRQQIKECALFVPILSANTQARREGYFRLEWKLAAQRTHTIADGTPFLLPVLIDGTRDAEALVPDEFRTVQWTKLLGGETSAAFVSRVQKLMEGTGAAVPAATPSVAPPSSVAPTAKSGRPSWFTLALSVAVLALVAYVVMRPGAKEAAPTAAPAKPAVADAKPTSVAPPVPAAPDPKSIAVLAFANLSADKDNEYFSDGLSEEILDKLARNPALRVMARTSSFSYKGKNVPISQIGRELNVGTIIEGSVRRAGNQLRITAQLINAADGTHIWSETYDKELTTAGIFAIQDEIAQKIAARLATGSAPAQSTVAVVPTKNLEAYEAYLRGRQTLTAGGPEKAMVFFVRATELDPGFALAWVQLARTHASRYASGGREGDIDEDREIALARAALDQAQRLQPDLPDIHFALAAFRVLVEQDALSATRELDLLARSRPEDSETCTLRGIIERRLGRISEAIAADQRAAEIDPKNASALNSLGISLQYAGRYPEAVAAFERAAQTHASVTPLVNRARALIRWRGDPKAAAASLRDVAAESLLVAVGSSSAVSVYWMAGDYAKALGLIDRTGQLGILGQYEYLFSDLLKGRIHEAMGEVEQAHRDYLAVLPQVERTRDAHPRSCRAYLPLAQVYAGLGRKEEALAAARRSLELQPASQDYLFAAISSLRVLVDVEGRFGMIDEALEVVKQQIAAGWWRRNELLLHPDFIHLQKDPRFRALAEKAPL